jgi:thiamine biosynthesis lipoprotein
VVQVAQELSARARGNPAGVPLPGVWIVRDEAIMGTSIHVELWSDDARTGRRAADAVIAEMHRIDHSMSPFKPNSELSHINRYAAQQPVPLSAEMFALLERALRFSELSDGAFDITYASVGRLYDYRAGVAPADAQLTAAREGIGWRHLILDRQARSVRFGHPLTAIDLGGFAKGHAVDNAAFILQRHGIEHAVVSAGGDSRILGDRRGRPWTIAIRHPRDAQRHVAVLPLEDTAISTSGDYERFFERDGVRHHHVIDPRTGRSAGGVHSVTILAPDGLTAEAMSKTLFVLGVERGMPIVESQPGVDAIVVDADGHLHCSAGLQAQDSRTHR